MDETSNLIQQIVKTQHLLQQGLDDLEAPLRALALAAAQINAELTLQSHRLILMDGRLSRMEALLNAAYRSEAPGVKP